jgi:hypothetical protein
MPMNGLIITGGAVIYHSANADRHVIVNANAPLLPSKTLDNRPRHPVLTGKLLNPVAPSDGEPVNLHRPMDK